MKVRLKNVRHGVGQRVYVLRSTGVGVRMIGGQGDESWRSKL
jgi:hypothetical protein